MSIEAASVYLDTSAIIDTIFPHLPNSPQARQFAAELTGQRSAIYFSQIMRLEIGEAVRKLATRQQAGELLRDEFNLARFNQNAQVRERWMAYGRTQFEKFTAAFVNVYEIPFAEVVWQRSLDLIAAYNLRGNDAAHAATALEYGVPVFATNDDHFLRVRELDVLLVRDLPP